MIIIALLSMEGFGQLDPQIDPAAVKKLTPRYLFGSDIDVRAIETACGEKIPDYILHRVFLWNFGTPDDVRGGNITICSWIAVNDLVVQWIAQRLELRPGKGLFFKKTGLPFRISYRSDVIYEGEYYQHPSYTSIAMLGDCGDCATCECSLMRAMGYRAMVIIGIDGNGMEHAWVEYKKNGKYYISDFCEGSIRVPNYRGYKGYKETNMFNDKVNMTPYDPNW